MNDLRITIIKGRLHMIEYIEFGSISNAPLTVINLVFCVTRGVLDIAIILFSIRLWRLLLNDQGITSKNEHHRKVNIDTYEQIYCSIVDRHQMTTLETIDHICAIPCNGSKWYMVPILSLLIELPGCPRPSIALTVHNRGLKHQSCILLIYLYISTPCPSVVRMMTAWFVTRTK